MRGARAALIWMALVASATLLTGSTVDRAEASCCVCRGGGCGAGFCADGIANLLACSNVCGIAGCPDGLFDPADVCAGGCDVAGPLPTATPTNTVNTPTRTPSVSPTLTSAAASPTQTPSLTPAGTATPAICCQGIRVCGTPLMSGNCAAGQETLPGFVCVAGVGGAPSNCGMPTLTPESTRTVTQTKTTTPTNTPANTSTVTPPNTVTATSTATITPIPAATDTPPKTPTPAVCCEQDASCSNVVGQFFSGTPRCAGALFRTPVPYAACVLDVGCRTFTATAVFSPTPPSTGTATQTPTITPTFAVPSSIDPYKCYRVQDTKNPLFKKRDVKLVDRFGNTTTSVLKPYLYCNPAIESSGSQPLGEHGDQVNPEAHTLCFKVRDRSAPAGVFRAPLPDLRVIFTDETPPPTPANTRTPAAGTFTTLRTDVLKGDLLCLPAAVIPQTPTPLKRCMTDADCRTPGNSACFELECRPFTPTPKPG
jgi:hypothetical protein